MGYYVIKRRFSDDGKRRLCNESKFGDARDCHWFKTNTYLSLILHLNPVSSHSGINIG